MRPRAAVLSFLAAGAFALLLARLAQLQILRYEYYARKARTKSLSLEVISPNRGPILDRNGVPIAWDGESYDVVVVPARFDRLLLLSLRMRRLGVGSASSVLMRPPSEGRGLVFLCSLSGKRANLLVRPPFDDGSVVARYGEGVVFLFARRRLLLELDDRIKRIAHLIGRDVRALSRRYKAVRERIISCRNAYERRHLLMSPHTMAEDVGRLAAMRVEVERWRLPGVLVVERRRRRYAGEPFGTLTGYLRLINAEEVRRLRKEKRLISRGYNSPSVFERIALKDCYFWDERVGACRLEAFFEGLLRGRKGARLLERDMETLGYRVLSEVSPRQGRPLSLTIDAYLQRASYEALKECGAKGAVVVVDPSDGAILAMVSHPSYDPELISNASYYREVLRRGAVIERCGGACYAPGSVMKVITAIAALSEGVTSRNETVNCRGYYRSPKAFKCWVYPNAHGPLNAVQAIQRSCNIFFFEMAERLGGSRLAEWFSRFGFGEKPLRLPWVKRGFLPSPLNVRPWYKGYARLLAIGQGQMLVSPLQVARAYCGIATGRLPSLRLLKGSPVDRIELGISDDVLALVREGMRLAVEGVGGTAYRIGLNRFHAAAKTGTAEVSKKENLNNAWIAGFAPYDDPKIVFVVLVERVKGHGGEVAGPVAVKVLEAFFKGSKGVER